MKILVKISGDKKLHLSWNVKYWKTDIRNGLNIKEVDL